MGIECPKCQFDNLEDSKFCKECGTQVISSEEISASPTKTLETPTEELTRGTTFPGRYEIKLLYRRLCYRNFTIIL